MFIKIGEITEISRVENASSCIPSVNQDILDDFKKTAESLKKIAPKAEDFLYFSAVMMHSAEASSLNEDGTPKLNAKGEAVQVGWDKTGGTWRWQTNDSSIKPYKNSNGDIFPEEELVKAYKKWVHKPLCIDHKSSSVDHVRGFIVDTYYDRNLKRVIALCALDKRNYPDLARKVSTGYSHSVSMGTAVGRAICSDCARVAKAEQDFCDHMKKKTCYGEINLDLNPIELSIVVSGADPKAYIKHIIAAANTLDAYVDNKSKEITKLAELKFSAHINVTDSDKDGDGSANFSIEANDLDELKTELDNIFRQVENFTDSAKKTEEAATRLALEEEGPPNLESSNYESAPPPHEIHASSNEELINSIKELHIVRASIEAKLVTMKNSLNKLVNTYINTQEENMSGSNEINKRGYYQGGGGVNEPTPGKSKYLKDTTNENMRLEGDKHMLGQDPFPDVGDVEGLAGVSELERKKMLARAESEERAMRRSAIVNLAKRALEDKKAYFQGGGGGNEPTPGRAKYPVDQLQQEVREDGDRHMVGQKPFPGVGSVQGLHSSPTSAGTPDELKRKQMLSRAALRARFVKAANHNGTQDIGNSAWEVFVGDRLLVTASVDELSGGNSVMLYDSIATKEFGSKLIEKVKVYGASGIRSLIKNAQAAPAAPAAPAALAPPAPAAPAAPKADLIPEIDDMTDAESEELGKEKDPKKKTLQLAEKVRDLSSDLVEAVRALTGEQSEMGVMEDAADGMGDAATGMEVKSSFTLGTLNTLRKELNGTLIHAMKESVAELNDHRQELRMIADVYDSGNVTRSNAEFVGSIVDDAVTEAKSAVADGFKLMTAFVKYARGTQAIVKRAQAESDYNNANGPNRTEDPADSREFQERLHRLLSDLQDDGHRLGGAILPAHHSNLGPDELWDTGGDADINDPDDPDDAGADFDDADDADFDDDDDSDDLNYADKDAKRKQDGSLTNMDGTPLKGDIADVYTVKGGLNSKSTRTALRAKLAADALGKMDDGEPVDMSKAEFSDMLYQSHKLTTDLGIDASGDLGEFDTLESRNRSMMDAAKAPVKVRKEAEAIHKLISEGKLDRNDLNALVSEGLDAEAVSYYKKYYSQVDGGSEFASELVKEHVKAQLEGELNAYKIKMARSYELAYDMVNRGLCSGDKIAIASQVDEIMKFNDDSFDSLKRVVAKHSPTMRKEAGRMPQVGMIGSGETNAPAYSVDSDWSELSAAFAKTSKRLF